MASTISIESALALLPELLLLILAILVLFYDKAVKSDKRQRIGLISAIGAFAILALVIGQWLIYDIPTETAQLLWGGMISIDQFTLVFRVLFLLVLALVSLLSINSEKLQHGEYFALLATSTIGFNLMAASADLVMLYVALETASISLYILAAFSKQEQRSVEAGIKYFIYGAFASAVMLYGLSLLYGLTGETSLASIAATVQQSSDVAVLLATVLIVVGFAFKVSAVPFHFWAPDVYEGAPSPVTALVSTASKAAGFAVFLRVVMSGALGGIAYSRGWWAMLVAMAIVTMSLGNFLAIFQSNMKRLLAYSSVAQAGYVMIGLVTLTEQGSAASLFYLLFYAFTNIAAFGVIIVLSNQLGTDELKDFSGLSRKSPFIALVMLFALLSLSGIPPTAGFFGKFFVFRAAIESGLWWLALIGILNAFVALYYYLSIIKYMYLYRSDDEGKALIVPAPAKVALAIATFGILYLGIFAGPTFEWTVRAATTLFSG